MSMKLTPEQQAVLDGEQGEVMAKIMKTLVMYGETFNAEKMVPVNSGYGHTVISFGAGPMKPVYDLYDMLLAAGVVSKQKFSADPRPIDPNVPMTWIQRLAAKKVVFPHQERYEEELRRLGLMNGDAFTCACYMDEIGNKPGKGEYLSWAESSAVVYANSVLGARCNRNSGVLEMFGSIAGCVPYFGFLTDDGRRADWIVEVRTTQKPEAQLLGSAIGMKVMEQVPYVKGLEKWLGTEVTKENQGWLKDFGAASASNGAVGLYHIEGLTPEAREQGESLIREGAPTYVIDDEELQRVQDNYPCIWKNLDAEPVLCFIGCPHLTLTQLHEWTERIVKSLEINGNARVTVPTVVNTAPATLKEFEKTEDFRRLTGAGVVVSYICPLMYMDNPLCSKLPVITCSNKLRTYTSARFYKEEQILEKITGGAK